MKCHQCNEYGEQFCHLFFVPVEPWDQCIKECPKSIQYSFVALVVFVVLMLVLTCLVVWGK